ncbi:hypothetical protein DyAD56_04000 [Dyella sp. AD56]|nr:hypothetical protein DyAD56_04000 [Dyella sp. AD56]ULU25656.1 hypothetical protein DYST_02590 [Dyella terrae]
MPENEAPARRLTHAVRVVESIQPQASLLRLGVSLLLRI